MLVLYLNWRNRDDTLGSLFHLSELTDKGHGQLLATLGVTVEIENGEKPVLVAEWLMMHVLG